MKGRRGKKRPAADLGQHMGQKAKSNLPELPNRTFIIVIRQVLNGNNDQICSVQHHALYPDVRHWEELIDFIEKKCGPKEPCCLSAI
jgi:hypothetical protein